MADGQTLWAFLNQKKAPMLSLCGGIRSRAGTYIPGTKDIPEYYPTQSRSVELHYGTEQYTLAKDGSKDTGLPMYIHTGNKPHKASAPVSACVLGTSSLCCGSGGQDPGSTRGVVGLDPSLHQLAGSAEDKRFPKAWGRELDCGHST